MVAADNRSGTVALVSHLIERHSTNRIFSVSGPPAAPDAVARHAALEQTGARYPGVQLIATFPGWFGSTDGQLAGREVLGLPRAHWPDAIVCGNDQMAIGVIRELLEAGVRVPADIAVVGFDDVHAGAMMSPALTTVSQQAGLLAERACARLLDRIADPASYCRARVELLPTKLDHPGHELRLLKSTPSAGPMPRLQYTAQRHLEAPVTIRERSVARLYRLGDRLVREKAELSFPDAS